MNIQIDKSRVLGQPGGFWAWLRASRTRITLLRSQALAARRRKEKIDPLPHGIVFEVDSICGVMIRPAPRPPIADYSPAVPLHLVGEAGFESWGME